jgi:hypothetical protein
MENVRIRACVASTLSITLAALLAACGGGSTNDASIGGTVSGIPTSQSAVIQNNGGDSVTLNANGSFAFPTRLSSGAAYSVTVLTQPTGAFCVVGSGTGHVDSSGDDVSSVAVQCIADWSLGGTVTGLKPGTAVTLFNGTVYLPITVDGQFTFPGLLANGANYSVTVATPPAGQTCSVVGGSGTISAGPVTTIQVTCT